MSGALVQTIAQQQWRLLLRDRRLALLGIALLVVLFTTAISAAATHRAEVDARAAAQAEEARIWRSQGPINPHGAAFAIFDRYTTGLENPAVLAAGRFDLAFVIVMLLPLLLIAATYDLWSRDVESGSARIQLAQPVRPARLILARAAVRGGAVLVPAVAIGTALLAPVSGGRDPAGLALFASVVLVYGIFWIALAATINLFVRTSTSAALASGTGWLILVILLPAMLAATADLIAPKPSLRDHSNSVRAATLDVRRENAGAARAASTATSGRAYPASLWHSRREIGIRDARLAPIHHAFTEASERHRSVAGALRTFSPAALVQDALDRIAGTDAARAVAFQEQARAFAATTRQLAFDWMDRDRLMTLADYDGGLPRFAFTEPGRTKPLGLDIAALLLFVLALLMVAALRLRRGAAALM